MNRELRRGHIGLAEVRRCYSSSARWYDAALAVPEALGVRALRRQLLALARGRVLDVGAGTGANLRWYPDDVEVTAVDLIPEMLVVARRTLERRAGRGRIAVMDAAQLAFPDGCFDTVVSTLSTCSFPEPVSALREMLRVCRRGGQVLLLEHGRTSNRAIDLVLDLGAALHARLFACRWNQDPEQLIRESGLRPRRLGRRAAGIYQAFVSDVPGRGSTS